MASVYVYGREEEEVHEHRVRWCASGVDEMEVIRTTKNINQEPSSNINVHRTTYISSSTNTTTLASPSTTLREGDGNRRSTSAHRNTISVGGSVDVVGRRRGNMDDVRWMMIHSHK